MTCKIHILPSGRKFISEGNTNLLEAGLQAGLALGYGCSNGNCGQCKAKIISGEVRKIRHHDFWISEEQQASGHVLMCCNVAITDVMLEAPEAKSSAEIPIQHIAAKVKSISLVNEDVALIHLKTPRSDRLRFLAGQHVRLAIDREIRSHQSVSSCPCDDMNLHFQIHRQSGDTFSEYVFTNLSKGDTVQIAGPRGNFVLNENSTRPMVFIAWFTGFGPVRSLVEHAMALEAGVKIQLLWVTAGAQDRYLDNLCRSWNDALDDFYYRPVDAGSRYETIEAASLLERLDMQPDELKNHDFYIAANQPLSGKLKAALLDAAVPGAQIKVDRKSTNG